MEHACQCFQPVHGAAESYGDSGFCMEGYQPGPLSTYRQAARRTGLSVSPNECAEWQQQKAGAHMAASCRGRGWLLL